MRECRTRCRYAQWWVGIPAAFQERPNLAEHVAPNLAMLRIEMILIILTLKHFMVFKGKLQPFLDTTLLLN